MISIKEMYMCRNHQYNSLYYKYSKKNEIEAQHVPVWSQTSRTQCSWYWVKSVGIFFIIYKQQVCKKYIYIFKKVFNRMNVQTEDTNSIKTNLKIAVYHFIFAGVSLNLSIDVYCCASVNHLPFANTDFSLKFLKKTETLTFIRVWGL